MRLDHYIHLPEVELLLQRLITQGDAIMSAVDDLQAKLNAVESSLDEASTEIVAEIQALKDQIATNDLTAANATADRLAVKGRGLADIVPNPPAPEPPTT